MSPTLPSRFTTIFLYPVPIHLPNFRDKYFDEVLSATGEEQSQEGD